jgi:hypothetical protein
VAAGRKYVGSPHGQGGRDGRDVPDLQAFRNHLTGVESLGDFEPIELMASYRSFCQREPIGGMFLELVIEEMLDRVKDGEPM